MFKEGIDPKWEDPNNKDGGAIVVTVRSNAKMSHDLDTYWLYTQLACIGENFTDGDAICGVNVSIRKSNTRLEIWVRDYKDDEVNKRIAQEFRDALELSNSQERVTFKSHFTDHAWYVTYFSSITILGHFKNQQLPFDTTCEFIRSSNNIIQHLSKSKQY